MKPMNFLKTLGSVDERYVEEMLEAKEHGAVTRHIRFDPMAAVGVLSGAAVCAAMIFGIMTLRNQGETLKPKDVGASKESIAETAETTTAAVAEVDMPAGNAGQQSENDPLFENRIIPESVNAESLEVTTQPTTAETDTADTTTTLTTVTFVMTDTKPEDVIHWPSDPVVDGTTTPTPEQFPEITTFKPEDLNAYIIAEFREAGGNPPKRVSDEESAEMNRLLEDLTIIPMPNSVAAAKLDGFVGGGYVIYAGDDRCVLYDETMIRADDTYYAITHGGKDLLDYVIAMVTKYQP